MTAGLLALGAASAAEPHPDLSGTWDDGDGIAFVRGEKQGANVCLFGCPSDAPRPAPAAAAAPAAPRPAPDFPKYKPEYEATVADLKDRQVEEDPVLRCMQPGVPRIGAPGKIVQSEKEVVFLYEDPSGPFFRVVPIGAKHRDDVDLSPLGDSIGWWEGDTLVVETTELSDDTWLTDNGAFHTPDLKVVERIRRDGDALVWEATAYDDEVLAEPWKLRPRRATPAVREIVVTPKCEDRDLAHMKDASYHANPR